MILKKFKNNSEIVRDLPNKIQKTLLGDFGDLIEDEIAKIAKIDNMNVPPGIFLKNSSDFKKKDKKLDNSTTTGYIDDEHSEDEFIDEGIVNDNGEKNETSNHTQKYNLRSKKVKFKEYGFKIRDELKLIKLRDNKVDTVSYPPPLFEELKLELSNNIRKIMGMDCALNALQRFFAKKSDTVTF